MVKKLLENKKILIITIVVLAVIGFGIGSCVKKHSTDSKKPDSNTEIEYEKDGEKENNTDDTENEKETYNGGGLEAADGNERMDEDSIDASGSWDENAVDSTQKNNQDKTDNNDNNKIEDTENGTENETDSENNVSDDDTLVDEKTWGDIF